MARAWPGSRGGLRTVATGCLPWRDCLAKRLAGLGLLLADLPTRLRMLLGDVQPALRLRRDAGGLRLRRDAGGLRLRRDAGGLRRGLTAGRLCLVESRRRLRSLLAERTVL